MIYREKPPAPPHLEADAGTAEYAVSGAGEGHAERRGAGDLVYTLDAAGAGSALPRGFGELALAVTGSGHGTSPVVVSGPLPEVPTIRHLTGGAVRRLDGGVDRRLDGGRINTLTLRRGT